MMRECWVEEECGPWLGLHPHRPRWGPALLPARPNVAFPKTILAHHSPILCYKNLRPSQGRDRNDWTCRGVDWQKNTEAGGCQMEHIGVGTHRPLNQERSTSTKEDTSIWMARGCWGKHASRRAHRQDTHRHCPPVGVGRGGSGTRRSLAGAVGGEPWPWSAPTPGENHLPSHSPICWELLPPNKTLHSFSKIICDPILSVHQGEKPGIQKALCPCNNEEHLIELVNTSL